MKTSFAVLALAGLAFTAAGCAKPEDKPATPPAPAPTTPAPTTPPSDAAPAPAPTTPPANP